jgi:hypothetical protein
MLLTGVLPTHSLASAVPETIQFWLNIDFGGRVKKRSERFSARRKSPGKFCPADGKICPAPGSYFHFF